MNNRFTSINIVVLILIGYFYISCKDINTPPQLDIQLLRFDNDLFQSPSLKSADQIAQLQHTYASFFEYYNQGVIQIGTSTDADYPQSLEAFLSDATVKLAKNKVDTVFVSIDDINKDLSSAFSYYHYYFPQQLVPTCIAFVGGFNQSIVLTDSVLAIGLDRYLNDLSIYTQLGNPKYLSYNMRRDRIVVDAITNWLKSEWPFDYNADNTVLGKMLYEGKQLYMAKQMLPHTADSTFFGFTQKQVDWCKANEKNMWKLLIDEKLLYNTERLNITKLTEDAPYTSYFPIESPGKACNWIAYRIVNQYMKNQSDVSLQQLMETQNNAKLLEQSKYNPK